MRVRRGSGVVAALAALAWLSPVARAGGGTSTATVVPAARAPALQLQQAWTDMPLWAYGVTSAPRPGEQAEPQGFGRHFDPTLSRAEQLKPWHVAGSRRSYSLYDVSDWASAVDWFPEEHGPMPHVVEHGPASLGAQARACAYCHKTTGGGRPENAPVAGLPVSYFIRQLQDFAAGRRRSSDPRKPNVPTMIALAQSMSDAERLAAAQYYAAQSGGPDLEVIESDRVPRTHLSSNRFVADGSERTEPLAGRIVEVARDPQQSEALANPHSGYIAYVPTGSIALGKRIAAGGLAIGGATPLPTRLACMVCHGTDLLGTAQGPPIAGRSPSYLVRQLYDFKSGARSGVMAVLMRPVVSRLTTAQVTDIAAFVASLPPRAPAGTPAR